MDPDQTAPQEQSDQGPQFLTISMYVRCFYSTLINLMGRIERTEESITEIATG